MVEYINKGLFLNVALTEMNLGNVLSAQGDYENALLHLQKALAIQEVALGPSRVRVAATYCNMGIVYSKLGNFQKALEMYGKDLEVTIKSLSDSQVSSANTKYNMALIHRKQGDNNLNQARILFQEAAVVHAKVYGAEHDETIGALNQAKGWDGVKFGGNEDAFTCLTCSAS
jgi:tetratricopeptide (TPR) repeat protein